MARPTTFKDYVIAQCVARGIAYDRVQGHPIFLQLVDNWIHEAIMHPDEIEDFVTVKRSGMPDSLVPNPFAENAAAAPAKTLSPGKKNQKPRGKRKLSSPPPTVDAPPPVETTVH